MMTYEEIQQRIDSNERIIGRHKSDARKAATLEQKVREQRRVKRGEEYGHWLKSNFYSLSDGLTKLSDFIPTTPQP